MGKKGRKTRWRKLPIPIGNQGKGGGRRKTVLSGGEEIEEVGDREDPPPIHNHHPRVTFNEDEYTKITTPRQDMLFKKGYLSKKRSPSTPQPPPDTADSQSAQSADSMESEQYICEEAIPQYVYPPHTGYIDHTGVYYLNGNTTYEMYDPYTGNVTVIVGPPAAYGGGQPVLAAVPCQPVPLQHVEWFNPLPQPQTSPQLRKKQSSADSQNCSAMSSESTCPPSSPQEPYEDPPNMMYTPQYIYPGYMFGAPLYNMNGVSVQGVVPQAAAAPADAKQRRKKRRRRRRGGVTDEGSESSCEEALSIEAGGTESGGGSGASSDAGPGSSCSKTNSDSGIHTEDAGAGNSGSNSPQLEGEGAQEGAAVGVEDGRGEEEGEGAEVLPQPPPSPPPPPLPGAVERLASDLASAALTEALPKAAALLAEATTTPEPVSKVLSLPITEAVTKWLESGGGSIGLAKRPDSSEDEGIEEGATEDDEQTTPTGQKNAHGNPFPAPSLSRYASGTRVASSAHCSVSSCDDASSAGEWDLTPPPPLPPPPHHHHPYHHHHHCPPLPGPPPLVYYPVADPALLHFASRTSGPPFPCGVCCLIQ